LPPPRAVEIEERHEEVDADRPRCSRAQVGQKSLEHRAAAAGRQRPQTAGLGHGGDELGEADAAERRELQRQAAADEIREARRHAGQR
jgi:hypothetical protein